MLFRFILLVFPTLASAVLEVFISGKYNGTASDLKISNILFSGDDVGIITSTERNTFKLSEDNLKNAVNKWFGKKPDNIYLHSPTPERDLYQLYNWQQVTRTLKPQRSKVLNITLESVLIHQQIFRNGKKIPKTVNVGIAQNVKNTIASSWSMDGKLSIDQNINYGIEVETVEDNRELHFFYNSPWGKNAEHHQEVTVGARSYMDIDLKPDQSVVSKIYTTKGIIRIQMEYEARIFGQIVASYANVYKGHYYWGLDITDCLSSYGLTHYKLSREVIDIEFYLDSKVVVYDQANGDTLLETAFQAN